MRKALIIATVVGFISSFERNDVKILQDLGYEVHCAANFKKYGSQEKYNQLLEMGIVQHHFEFTRNPFGKNNYSCYKELIALMKQEKYDLVHCHTPIGGVLGRLAAHKMKVPHVLYTAHGFHFYKGAPLKNWLMYYPVEKWLSRKTDIIITINKEDYETARDRFNSTTIEYVPGVGVDTKKFKPDASNYLSIRQNLGITNADIMLLSVGELSSRKNHIAVMKAINDLPNEMKENIHYFIVGEGALLNDLKDYAQKHNLNVVMLGYRTDVADLCNATDIFVLPSIQEGLSVALMEAMSTGALCICSRIRGNTDLIDDEKRLFAPSEIREIAECISTNYDLAIEHFRDKNATMRMKEFFSQDVIQDKMMKIYSSLQRG